MEVSAKYLKDEQNKIVSPIVSSETVMMGGTETLDRHLEYASFMYMSQNKTYNVSSGFTHLKINLNKYYQYDGNKYLYNKGDGYSIGIKSTADNFIAKLEAFCNIHSTIAREVYLGIVVNDKICAESYVTTTSTIPYQNIYVCNPYMELKKNDAISLHLYSNQPGNILLQVGDSYPKISLTVSGIC